MQLDRSGDVFILLLGDGENRIDPAFITELGETLDTVGRVPAPRALVTSAAGRFYSNGLDLDRAADFTDLEMLEFTAALDHLLARLLVAPFITVAAINGHCFAAGALLALCHDFRVMRADRGYFALPSVDVRIPFTSGMTSLIREKIPQPAAHSLVVSADRIGGEAAALHGIVTATAPEGDVVPAAVEHAARLAAKDPATLGTIKSRMYGSVVELLEGSGGTSARHRAP